MNTETRRTLKQSVGWAVGLGILLIILGFVAIATPFFASIAVGIFLGWLFMIGGIVQAIYAFQHDRRRSSLIFHLLLGILSIVAGILLVVNPLAGVVSLTLIIGIYFFIDGVFRVFLAFQLKPDANWGWVLLNGILLIILGILIWSEWPFSATWVLGLLVGVGLLFSGISTIAFVLAARQALHRPEQN
jgi:uncharacterized membrane protein HdeD (DUF308 family)